MKKNEKKLFSFVLALFPIFLVLFTPPVRALASVEIPEPSTEFYVYDEAQLLSEETEQLILDVNRHYEETEEQPQIVVATVESMQGETIEDYSIELFEQWGIGSQDLDNGVLILLSEEEREIRFEVGYGLEGALTDSGTGAILDRNITELQNDDFDSALQNIFTETAVEINNEYQYDHDTIFSGYQVDTTRNDEEGSFSSFFFFLILMFILSGFFGRGGGGGGSGGYRGRRRPPIFFGGGMYGGGYRGGGFGGGGGGFGGGGGSGGGGSSRGF